jgi:glycerol-3-phosphate acyltransferase PlsY
VAAALTPVYSLWLIDSVNARWIILLTALLLISRHHGNIRRLLAKEESKSG